MIQKQFDVKSILQGYCAPLFWPSYFDNTAFTSLSFSMGMSLSFQDVNEIAEFPSFGSRQLPLVKANKMRGVYGFHYINLSILISTTSKFNKHKPIMMTKTLFITVASVLLSNVVCNVVSDIQILTSNDDIQDEDTVVRVEITNDRVLETLEPADR